MHFSFDWMHRSTSPQLHRYSDRYPLLKARLFFHLYLMELTAEQKIHNESAMKPVDIRFHGIDVQQKTSDRHDKLVM